MGVVEILYLNMFQSLKDIRQITFRETCISLLLFNVY